MVDKLSNLWHPLRHVEVAGFVGSIACDGQIWTLGWQDTAGSDGARGADGAAGAEDCAAVAGIAAARPGSWRLRRGHQIRVMPRCSATGSALMMPVLADPRVASIREAEVATQTLLCWPSNRWCRVSQFGAAGIMELKDIEETVRSGSCAYSASVLFLPLKKNSFEQ